MREVERQAPVPVLGADGDDARLELQPLVLQRTDALTGGGHTDGRRLGHVEQQLVGVLDVIVEREVPPSLEHGQVHTDVGREGALPRQVGVADGDGHGADALVVVILSLVLVRGHGLVRREAHVAGVAHAGTQLEQLHGDTLHEALLVDVPSAADTPERCEAFVLSELRRAFVAVDDVEEVLLVPHGVDVDEEADAALDTVAAGRCSVHVAGGKGWVSQLVGEVAGGAIGGVAGV